MRIDSGEFKRVDSLYPQNGTGIAQAGLDILVRQAGIVAQDFRFAPALGQQINNQLDGNVTLN